MKNWGRLTFMKVVVKFLIYLAKYSKQTVINLHLPIISVILTPISTLIMSTVWVFAQIMTYLNNHLITRRHTPLPVQYLSIRWTSFFSQISYLFDDLICPQLAVERANAGVSNPRDLWDAPAVALRFAGAIGLIPGLDWRESGETHT